MLFFIGQVVSCMSSSTLVDIWQNPTYQAPPLTKMLVISVRKNATKRRIFEDAFSSDLVKHGVLAISSYSLFPDALPDTDQVLSTIKTNGFDGVLVIRRLPTETNKHYVPGYVTTEDNAYPSYWQRYGSYYRELEYPGYIDSQAIDIRAIDVSTTGKGGNLIWSATSRTPDPETVVDVQQGIVSLVMSKLEHRGIINSKR